MVCHTLEVTTQEPGRTRWPSLLTVREAAQMLGHNEQTIREWLRAGVIRGRRMHTGSYVIARGELVVDIARHRHAVAEATGRYVRRAAP